MNNLPNLKERVERLEKLLIFTVTNFGVHTRECQIAIVGSRRDSSGRAVGCNCGFDALKRIVAELLGDTCKHTE